MLKRDPQDRRYPERLTGSSLASIILHVIAAAFFFTVATSSSREGATESVVGGQVVTVERDVPVVAQVQPAAPQPAAPVPVAPRIAPIHHTVVTQAAQQKQPPAKRELSHIVPKAPPQPRPVPQASVAPAPQPTEPVFDPKPENDIAAVPVAVPTIAAVAVTIKIPPTAAPSPVPSIAASPRPTAKPQPVPTVVPTARPATPAPAAPTAAPTAKAVVVVAQASAQPISSAAPAAVASHAPATKSGVPSPSPTQGTQLAAAKGVAPTPGPKGESTPGPRAGNAGLTKPGPSRPITVPTTPSPAPTATQRPSAGGGGNNAVSAARNFLMSLTGNPVTPTSKNYDTAPSIKGRLSPTPPPEVLARTKYIYETPPTLLSGEPIKMWVTNVHKGVGGANVCDGWQIRYPDRGDPTSHNMVLYGGGPPPVSLTINGEAPIVDGMTSVPCSEKRLTPFTP